MSAFKTAALATAGFLISFGLQGCLDGDVDDTTTTTTVAPPGPGGVEKVKVQFWGESGCPYSSKFMTESLDTAVKAVNISEIMEFDMFPYGNAYYITADNVCGGEKANYSWTNMSTYSSHVRDCFIEKCGPSGGDSVECYRDGPYCQHGEAECVVNRLQLCNQKFASDQNLSFTDYVPFASCLQRQYTLVVQAKPQKGLVPDEKVIDDVVQSCVAGDGNMAKQIMYCYSQKNMSHASEVQMAQKTIPHQSVPLVRVTNKEGEILELQLEDLDRITTDTLLQAVCDAWEFNGGNRSIVPQCPSATTTTTTTQNQMIFAV